MIMILMMFLATGRSNASTRTFYGEISRIEYEAWDITRVVFEFQFKTQESDVMLLYAISSKNKNGKPFIINISVRARNLVLGIKVRIQKLLSFILKKLFFIFLIGIQYY